MVTSRGSDSRTLMVCSLNENCLLSVRSKRLWWRPARKLIRIRTARTVRVYPALAPAARAFFPFSAATTRSRLSQRPASSRTSPKTAMLATYAPRSGTTPERTNARARRSAPNPAADPFRNLTTPPLSAPALRVDHALGQEQRQEHDAQVEHDVLRVEQPLLEVLQVIDERHLVEQIPERR